MLLNFKNPLEDNVVKLGKSSGCYRILHLIKHFA